jgi:hypothetical protein
VNPSPPPCTPSAETRAALAPIAHLISPSMLQRATKMRPRAARWAAVHHPQAPAPAPRPEDVDDPQTGDAPTHYIPSIQSSIDSFILRCHDQ